MMGEAVDQMRNDVFAEESPYEFGSRLSSAQIRRAIDEYDAAAATAGRLMAEVAELRRAIVGMGDMMAALGADRDEWRKRAEAAEAAVRVYQYEACGISMTEAARDAQFPDLTEGEREDIKAEWKAEP